MTQVHRFARRTRRVRVTAHVYYLWVLSHGLHHSSSILSDTRTLFTPGHLHNRFVFSFSFFFSLLKNVEVLKVTAVRSAGVHYVILREGGSPPCISQHALVWQQCPAALAPPEHFSSRRLAHLQRCRLAKSSEYSALCSVLFNRMASRNPKIWPSLYQSLWRWRRER